MRQLKKTDFTESATFNTPHICSGYTLLYRQQKKHGKKKRNYLKEIVTLPRIYQKHVSCKHLNLTLL